MCSSDLSAQTNKKIGLKSSINVSLNNKEIFRPKNKKGFKWGQIICGKKYESRIGITSSNVRKIIIYLIGYMIYAIIQVNGRSGFLTSTGSQKTS